jgi:hypothetical protein
MGFVENRSHALLHALTARCGIYQRSHVAVVYYIIVSYRYTDKYIYMFVCIYIHIYVYIYCKNNVLLTRLTSTELLIASSEELMVCVCVYVRIPAHTRTYLGSSDLLFSISLCTYIVFKCLYGPFLLGWHVSI